MVSHQQKWKSIVMPLVRRRQHVCQGYSLKVTATYPEMGAGVLRRLALADYQNQTRDGLAVARDGQAFSLRDAVEQVLAPKAGISSLTS